MCSKIPPYTCRSELYKPIKHKKYVLKTVLNKIFKPAKHENLLKGIHMLYMQHTA